MQNEGIDENAKLAQSAKLVQEFLKEYETSEQYYKDLADHVSKLCEGFLTTAKVKANVKHRAKSTEGLKRKLQDRGCYASVDEIREDIVDLSGVRIALFIPDARSEVRKIILDEFELVGEVTHPKPNRGESHSGNGKGKARRKVSFKDGEEGKTAPKCDRVFQGYQATHFWVRLGKKHELRNFRPNDQVEIQIMTVLQSAWSEVEHDIVYKQLEGDPSDLELQILDGLNGLVTIGEKYLSNLSAIKNSRISSDGDRKRKFDNEYELGAFLLPKISRSRSDEEFTVSAMETLRKFLGLRQVDADTKAGLEKELSNLRIDADLKTSFKTPNPKKPNAVLVVMERIYFKKLLSEAAGAQPPCIPTKKCQILVSTVISLDELFPPVSFWERELTCRGGQDSIAAQPETLENLKWLVSAQQPRNVVLGDSVNLDPTNVAKLEWLWQWFSSHHSNIIQFVFGISKLGVQRNQSRDLEMLDRLNHMVQSVFERRLGESKWSKR